MFVHAYFFLVFHNTFLSVRSSCRMELYVLATPADKIVLEMV